MRQLRRRDDSWVGDGHAGVMRFVFILQTAQDGDETASQKARFILATDGDRFEAEDVTTGETVVCDYPDFANHFGFFLPLAGITTIAPIRESSFDVRANWTTA